MQLDGYHITFTKDILAIGYEQYSIAEWKAFSDEEISNMDKDEDALEWWHKWKDFIFLAIDKCFKATT